MFKLSKRMFAGAILTVFALVGSATIGAAASQATPAPAQVPAQAHTQTQAKAQTQTQAQAKAQTQTPSTASLANVSAVSQQRLPTRTQNALTSSILDPEDEDSDSPRSHLRTPGTTDYDEADNDKDQASPNSRERILDVAVEELKNNPPVYVDPRAQLELTPEQQNELAVKISGTSEPIFVAILPSQAGRPTVVTETIAREVGKPGVYVTIVGVVYSAYSSQFEAKHVITQAFVQERLGGQAAVLNRFVDLASQEMQGRTPEPQPFPVALVFIVAAMALALPIVLLLSARRNKVSRSAKPQTDEVANPTANDTET